MNNQVIYNCKIVGTSLSMADHGCLTFFIFVEGEFGGVGIGGYCIGHGYLGASSFDSQDGNGLVAMMKIMDTVGVSRWEDLKGKYCRVKVGKLGETVSKIGNLIDDRWFDVDDFFKKCYENKGE